MDWTSLLAIDISTTVTPKLAVINWYFSFRHFATAAYFSATCGFLNGLRASHTRI
jgi:hypothetical protein